MTYWIKGWTNTVNTAQDFGLSASDPFVMTTYNPEALASEFYGPGTARTYAFYEDVSGLLGTDPQGYWALSFLDITISVDGIIYFAEIAFTVEE